MPFDPTSIAISALFVDPDMFDSRKKWRRAGFDVFDPAKDIECMVAAHPSAPGYLFKRYRSDVPAREQNPNYKRRVDGSRELAKLIAEKHLAHVVVPKKYLHELPKTFRTSDRSAYVLIVERMDILGEEASAKRYKDITKPVLYDLLRVLIRFKGLDSNSKNVQFTKDGKIAFVDLENYNRTDRKLVQLRSIGTYLSKDGRKLASKILDELAS